MKPITIAIFLFFNTNVFSQFEKYKTDSSNGNLEMYRRLNPSFQMLTHERIKEMHSVADRLKPSAISNRDGHWQLIGPTKINSLSGGFILSGRVRDINFVNDKLIRVAAASGGLWEVNYDDEGKKNIKHLTKEFDVVTSGAVSTDPFDNKIIFYGTGEPNIRGGSGLYITKDGGLTWKSSNLPKNAVYTEIEHTGISEVVWCTSGEGIYLTKNGGDSWQKKRSGNFWGLAVDFSDPNKAWAATYEGKIYKTTNGGTSWNDVSLKETFEKPIERIELSNCRAFPEVIYASVTIQGGVTGGIFKTSDGGNNWIKCNLFDLNSIVVKDFHWGQGWYNSMISVSPTNPNHCIVGGGWWLYTVDGLNFYGPAGAQHPDFHACDWSADGKKFIIGNDGGMFKAEFDGKTVFEKAWEKDWDVSINELPITQFGSIAVSKKNSELMIGGTQDNGLVYSHLPNYNWFAYGGDGGNVAMDPEKEDEYYGLNGLFSGDLTFRTFKKIVSSPGAWEDISKNIKASTSWGRIVEFDQKSPPVLYSTSGNYIYKTEDKGKDWELVNGDDVEFDEIHSLAFSGKDETTMYFTGLSNKSDTDAIFRIDLENYDFFNLTKGLPSKRWDGSGYNYTVPYVFTPKNGNFDNAVFVLMRGIHSEIASKRIFKSDDKGINWINITGNLPDLPYTTMLIHPFDLNTIAVGTDGFGVFMTQDGGQNWINWSDGLPRAAIITDMDFQLLDNNQINLVMSTYGNGIFNRYLPSGNVSLVENQKLEEAEIFEHVSYNGQSIEISLKYLPIKSILTIHALDGKIIGEYSMETTSDYHLFKRDIVLQQGLYFISLIGKGKTIETIKFIVP